MELTESRKLIINDLILKFKENDTYSMWKTEVDDFLKDKSDAYIITEILKYRLKFIKLDTKDTYRLTRKGNVFTNFKKP